MLHHRHGQGAAGRRKHIYRKQFTPAKSSAKGIYYLNRFDKLGHWRSSFKPESEWGHVNCEPIVTQMVWNQADQIIEEQLRIWPLRSVGAVQLLPWSLRPLLDELIFDLQPSSIDFLLLSSGGSKLREVSANMLTKSAYCLHTTVIFAPLKLQSHCLSENPSFRVVKLPRLPLSSQKPVYYREVKPKGLRSHEHEILLIVQRVFAKLLVCPLQIKSAKLLPRVLGIKTTGPRLKTPFRRQIYSR